jgi:HK97 family phage prohead protease
MEVLKKDLTFEIGEMKEDDDGFFKFEGYASTKDIDLVDDIVEPMAFAGDVGGETPMLWQHNRDEPIGVFYDKRIDDKGLFVRGKMPKEDDFVRGRVIPQMKAGSIKAMSIGFYVKKSTYDTETNVRIITEAKLREVSLVTFPANPAAVVTGMKAEEKIQAIKDGRLTAVTISKEDLGELSLSQIKFAIRQGLLSKDAASFVSGLIIGATRQEATGEPVDPDAEFLKALEEVFREDKTK